MLTIEDIRNPDRKSGFDRVNTLGGSLRPSGTQRRKLQYRALYKRTTNPPAWERGPIRATPEEAAQDYCDYTNGNGLLTYAESLKSAGHTGKRITMPRDEEVEMALGIIRDHRAQQEGKQGWVYLIGVELDPYAVKIGYSTNVPVRLRELQTGNPRKLFLLGSFEGTKEDERRIHFTYIEDNLYGEWFRPSSGLFGEFGLAVEDACEEVVYA